MLSTEVCDQHFHEETAAKKAFSNVDKKRFRKKRLVLKGCAPQSGPIAFLLRSS
jgi:hypothetical protein